MNRPVALSGPAWHAQRTGAPRFRAAVASDPAQALDGFEALARQGAALPFQRRNWLANWYGAHAATHRPVLASIFRGDTGELAMALPLALHRDGALRVIAFADAGLTDYNAPVLGPAAPRAAADLPALLDCLRKALPRADVLDFGKMPEAVGPLPNLFALSPQATPSRLGGNILRVPGAWDDWHRGLERTFRKELERSLRVFLKHEGAEFRRISTLPEAAQVMAQLKVQQRERMKEQGLPYILDDPQSEALYDGLVRDGLATGETVLTALTAGDKVVAALLGASDGNHFAMVRLSTAGAEWKNCSPGRLLIERTMKSLHGEGHRIFDFTIGDYPYKRRFGTEPVPLRELKLALSWRGLPHVAGVRAKAFVKGNEKLAALARKWLGQ